MKPKHLEAGQAGVAQRIAYLERAGDAPPIVWLGGFRSDMRATKATALDEWAGANNRAFVRFDYSGHGESDGDFEEGTISRWLADTMAVLRHCTSGRPVLVGSSMGGWLALLAARQLAEAGRPPAGLVLLAPAPDFTERLIWDQLDEAARHRLDVDGAVPRPSEYGPPIPITAALIADGRRHLLLGRDIVRAHGPVHIIQGMMDKDVPWRHATELMEHLAHDPAVMTLIKDGDHRLSRPQDIERMLAAVATITAPHPPAEPRIKPDAGSGDPD